MPEPKQNMKQYLDTRQDTVEQILNKTSVGVIPEKLFSFPEEVWRREQQRPNGNQHPFRFHVIGVGDVDLNTTVEIHGFHCIVLHQLGSSHRLSQENWGGMKFVHIFLQTNVDSKTRLTKKLELLRVKQVVKKHEEVAVIELELTGDSAEYADWK